MRLELTPTCPGAPPVGRHRGRRSPAACTGAGLGRRPAATGTLRVAPVAARRIRYRLDFTAADGRAMHLDGWKSVSLRRPLGR